MKKGEERLNSSREYLTFGFSNEGRKERKERSHGKEDSRTRAKCDHAALRGRLETVSARHDCRTRRHPTPSFFCFFMLRRGPEKERKGIMDEHRRATQERARSALESIERKGENKRRRGRERERERKGV